MAKLFKFLVPLGLLTFACSGCGVSISGQDGHVRQTGVQSTQTRSTPIEIQTPPGQVRLDGLNTLSLSSQAIQQYYAQGGTNSIQTTHDAPSVAFSKLCQGQVDIVDSTSPIDSANAALCKRNGFQVIQFKVASQSIVLATKAETDIGVDCLTVSQIQDMYRAGSPLYNWQQLGYDQVPLQITGPSTGSTIFNTFDEEVLGSVQPSLLDFSSSYIAQPNSMSERLFIIGTPNEEAQAALIPQLRSNVANLQAYLAGAQDTLAGAQQSVSDAAFQVQKGIHDQRPASVQAQDAQTLISARAKLASAKNAVNSWQAQLNSALGQLHYAEAQAGKLNGTLGRVGYFSLSYYQLFEEQLRPLEVTWSANPINCIFPSQITATNGSYPLSWNLLLTTTQSELERGEVRSFLLSYLNNAENLAQQQQLVPLPLQTINQELAVLNNIPGGNG